MPMVHNNSGPASSENSTENASGTMSDEHVV